MQLGGNSLSSVYIRTLAFVTLGFFQCQEYTSLEEVVNYFRYTTASMELVEKTLGQKVDYDPLECLNSEKAELVKYAIEVDKEIHKREKDPYIGALEETLMSNFSKEEASTADELDVDNDMLETQPDLLKEAGDGLDLESETIHDLVKNAGDGSDLPDEESVSEVYTKKMDGLEELDAMIGLAEVKQQVKAMLNVHLVRKRCEELGIKRPSISMHMVFTGNPGTGKTSVARILGKVYQEAGLLSKGHFVEVTRAELVGKYVGHTAVMVKELFEKARGGVLFIDEAYSLSAGGDSFGEEAIETLLKLMEDNRGDIVVIVAGYPKLMQDFLESNPGLRSRFPLTINFPDYTADELVKIFKCFCAENDMVVEHSIMTAVKTHFSKESARHNRNCGNARAVRNYFEKMILNQANRLVNNGTFDRNDLCSFCVSDIPENRLVSGIGINVPGKNNVLVFNG